MGICQRRELGIADLLVEKYQGIRPAVGYPSLPDQSVNFLLDELLDMKQIGISLTETELCTRTLLFADLCFHIRLPNTSPSERLEKTNWKIMPATWQTD